MTMKVQGLTLVEVTLTAFYCNLYIFIWDQGPGTHTLASLQEKLFFNELRQTWFAAIYKENNKSNILGSNLNQNRSSLVLAKRP